MFTLRKSWREVVVRRAFILIVIAVVVAGVALAQPLNGLGAAVADGFGWGVSPACLAGFGWGGAAG